MSLDVLAVLPQDLHSKLFAFLITSWSVASLASIFKVDKAFDWLVCLLGFLSGFSNSV